MSQAQLRLSVGAVNQPLSNQALSPEMAMAYVPQMRADVTRAIMQWIASKFTKTGFHSDHMSHA